MGYSRIKVDKSKKSVKKSEDRLTYDKKHDGDRYFRQIKTAIIKGALDEIDEDLLSDE